MICSTSNGPLFDIKLIFCQITPSMFDRPAFPWNSDILALIWVRVGQTGPFLKNFQLRYSGPVKKLRNGLNKKILQKKIQNFFDLTRNLQKTNVRGCVIFCSRTFLFMNRFCHSWYSKCSKFNYKINGKGFILISLKLTEKSKTA